jgi:quercetin dioxygenase-like cupin family protein
MRHSIDPEGRALARETHSRSDSISGLMLTEWVHARGSSMPRHHHEPGCIALTLDGRMVETYDTARVERMQGTVLYRPPGEPHACATDSDGARCFVVEFDA